jgi:hypothetical protein
MFYAEYISVLVHKGFETETQRKADRQNADATHARTTHQYTDPTNNRQKMFCQTPFEKYIRHQFIYRFVKRNSHYTCKNSLFIVKLGSKESNEHK